MSTRSLLDLSSGHLSPETWAWLDAQTAEEVVRNPRRGEGWILGGRTRYGWLVYADEDPAPPIPADLIAVMRLARARGCEYVLLDCDAAPMEDLPVLHPDFADAAASVPAAAPPGRA